jgi:cytochrome c-type biogenesis protein CcmH/NrfF
VSTLAHRRSRIVGAPVLGSRVAYLLLGVVVIGALLLGSHRASPPSAASRIAHLEGIIKCPDCVDLTIAQSQSAPAVGLRHLVASEVDAGASDATIEQEVVARYGSGEILTPSGTSGAIAIGVPVAAFSLAAGALGITFTRRRRRGGTGPVPLEEEDLLRVAAARAEHRGVR